MIVNGWLDWAIRMPSTAGKVNGYNNPVRGIFMHSAEGYAGTLLSPTSEWGYNGSHSWHLSNCMDGRLVQHFPLSAQCWHATAANNAFIGVENEGDYPKEFSLTAAQIANARRFIAEISQAYGWKPRRPYSKIDTLHTLWEHNEVTRIGGTSSECPSGRIPWHLILEEQGGDVEVGMIGFNAPAEFFNSAYFAASITEPNDKKQYYRMQAQDDFKLPDNVKDILISVEMMHGVSTWYDGGSERLQREVVDKNIFWARMSEALPGDRGKTLNFRAEGDCQFKRVDCLAYNIS